MKELRHYAGMVVATGPHSDLVNADNITGNCTRIFGSARNLTGDISGLTGDVSGLRGDATGALLYMHEYTYFGDISKLIYLSCFIATLVEVNK
jgi:hypothetical protein